jgi:hypothetical protein
MPALSPIQIGKLHNEILKELDVALLNGNEISSIEEFTKKSVKVSEEILFNRLNYEFISDSYFNYLVTRSNEIVFERMVKKSKSQSEANNDLARVLLTEFDSVYNTLDSLNVLNVREEKIMREIIRTFMNYEETKNLDKLKEDIDNHKRSIQDSDFDPIKVEGYFSEMILSIAGNSIEYWTADSVTKYNDGSKIIWWVVSDAVGAALSAGASIAKDAVNGDEVDWTDAAFDGLIGGVLTSLPGGKALKKVVKRFL